MQAFRLNFASSYAQNVHHDVLIKLIDLIKINGYTNKDIYDFVIPIMAKRTAVSYYGLLRAIPQHQIDCFQLLFASSLTERTDPNAVLAYFEKTSRILAATMLQLLQYGILRYSFFQNLIGKKGDAIDVSDAVISKLQDRFPNGAPVLLEGLDHGAIIENILTDRPKLEPGQLVSYMARHFIPQGSGMSHIIGLLEHAGYTITPQMALEAAKLAPRFSEKSIEEVRDMFRGDATPHAAIE